MGKVKRRKSEQRRVNADRKREKRKNETQEEGEKRLMLRRQYYAKTKCNAVKKPSQPDSVHNKPLSLESQSVLSQADLNHEKSSARSTGEKISKTSTDVLSSSDDDLKDLPTTSNHSSILKGSTGLKSNQDKASCSGISSEERPFSESVNVSVIGDPSEALQDPAEAVIRKSEVFSTNNIGLLLNAIRDLRIKLHNETKDNEKLKGIIETNCGQIKDLEKQLEESKTVLLQQQNKLKSINEKFTQELESRVQEIQTVYNSRVDEIIHLQKKELDSVMVEVEKAVADKEKVFLNQQAQIIRSLKEKIRQQQKEIFTLKMPKECKDASVNVMLPSMKDESLIRQMEEQLNSMYFKEHQRTKNLKNSSSQT